MEDGLKQIQKQHKGKDQENPKNREAHGGGNIRNELSGDVGGGVQRLRDTG
jgi:hypothetical protein